METIDTNTSVMRTLPMCENEIPGAAVFHVTIPAGETLVLPADEAHYQIFVLMEGSCTMKTAGAAHEFTTRVTFVPAPEEEMTLTAGENAQLLKILWDITPEDVELRSQYATVFPLVIPYAEAIQYVDPNKSPKTISRMMIPHQVLPRFTIGSVESYGYDLVRPHAHPMLDQFFFSFPENDMEVIIDDEKINMKGNIIMHIPLGSNHGVEVTGDRHMHYMWIDFMPDKEAGLKRLNFSHRPTGTVRDFANEDKHR
jgi:mannose-6-phosphate isomerase-like protein (cupin superfamily)